MESSNIEKRRKSGILKSAQQQRPHHEHSADHVKFDEHGIEIHDQDRGTRQQIDEPKTPYHYEDQADVVEEEQNQEALIQESQNQEDVAMVDVHVEKEIEEEVKQHLLEAEKNKQLNAHLQKEEVQVNLEHKGQHHSLAQKLQEAQDARDEEAKKHEDFEKKRKEHYKQEFSPAMLLKRGSMMEDCDQDEEEVGNLE